MSEVSEHLRDEPRAVDSDDVDLCTGVARRLYLAGAGDTLRLGRASSALTLPDLGVAAGVLLVAYPAVDTAAALVEEPGHPPDPDRTGVGAAVAVGSLAAVGLAVASFSGVLRPVRVWGAWAVVAGLLQIVPRRWRTAPDGGQVTMALSGAGSIVAGAVFVLVGSTNAGPWRCSPVMPWSEARSSCSPPSGSPPADLDRRPPTLGECSAPSKDVGEMYRREGRLLHVWSSQCSLHVQRHETDMENDSLCQQTIVRRPVGNEHGRHRVRP